MVHFYLQNLRNFKQVGYQYNKGLTKKRLLIFFAFKIGKVAGYENT
jgi:hypothetical protein